jgi:ketosteroid isomerase-like protein
MKFTVGDTIVAERRFEHHEKGEDRSFDGSTIATVGDGRILRLREYATTAALYDWEGEWQ